MRPLHVHVEEPSMRAFLEDLLPRAIPAQLSWKIIDHRSKWQLLREVPARLTGYAQWAPEYRPKVLILVDRDDDDCRVLKADLDVACLAAGLALRTNPRHGGYIDVVNRIVIEELEAWFFGDVPALVGVFPGVPPSLGDQARFRDPDAILGGTHEALLAVLQKAGHLKGVDRLPKIDTARRMGASIDIQRNRSRSFHAFLTGLSTLVEAA